MQHLRVDFHHFSFILCLFLSLLHLKSFESARFFMYFLTLCYNIRLPQGSPNIWCQFLLLHNPYLFFLLFFFFLSKFFLSLPFSILDQGFMLSGCLWFVFFIEDWSSIRLWSHWTKGFSSLDWSCPSRISVVKVCKNVNRLSWYEFLTRFLEVCL